MVSLVSQLMKAKIAPLAAHIGIAKFRELTSITNLSVVTLLGNAFNIRIAQKRILSLSRYY